MLKGNTYRLIESGNRYIREWKNTYDVMREGKSQHIRERAKVTDDTN